MALEQVFECPDTIGKLRNGPLRELLDGYCGWLLSQQYRRATVRRHLRHVGRLNSFLGGANAAPRRRLDARDIAVFLRRFSAKHQNHGLGRWSLHGLRYAIHRFVLYLELNGRFDRLVSPPHYQPLLDSYLEWMRQLQNATEGTVAIRTHSICQFLQWLGPQATAAGLSELTAERIEQFILEYAQRSGRAARRSMQSAMRTFLRFGLHAGLVRGRLDLAVPTLRTYKLSTVPRGLSEAHASQLLKSVDRSRPAGLRDYAILQMLHSYGVRGAQVRALRLTDIEWAEDRIRFQATKHGKDSVLPLTAEVGASLLEYLQHGRPPGTWPEVFLTCRPPYRPLSASSNLSIVVRSHIQTAGLQVACQGAHAFRHGFASRMVAQGHSLKAVADVLGHRHLSTTFLYAKVDFKALDQVALDWPEETTT